MSLKELGYNDVFEAFRKENSLDSFEVARVTSEHRDRYIVKNESNEFDAELIGNLRFSANSRSELPAVGDWVAITEYDEDKALIHAVFPRFSLIERKAVGKISESQIIATNIDVGLIVQAVNRDFSINRLERYLTICHASKIEPIIVLNKIDLIEHEELEVLLNQISERIKNVEIIPISNFTQIGVVEVKRHLTKGKTFCFLGSSGVGKSTLINSIIGEDRMETGEISQGIDRGKHVTTHRELLVLENGVLIDNPGMREVGVTASSESLEMTFDEISDLSQNCKFRDCTHTNEKGCAVRDAIKKGELFEETFENFQKLERESDFFESSSAEKKQKDKNLGKLIRQSQKIKRNSKY